MAIPDSILRKPGPLMPDEIAIMKEHCYRGYQMLQSIPFLAEAAQIVYSHHEHWDGSGYPRGIRGDAILLGARIVAVANTLDSIMFDESYRAAQPFSTARDEIIRKSGRQFDPDLMKVFLSIPESIWHELRKEIDAKSIVSRTIKS